MKHLSFSKQLGFLALLGALLVTTGVLAAGEQITRYVFASGGEEVAAGDYKLRGALGQPVAGSVSTTSHRLCSGFWCGGAGQTPSTYFTYLPFLNRVFTSVVILSETGDACPGSDKLAIAPPEYMGVLDHAQDQDWYTFDAVQSASYTFVTYKDGAVDKVDTLLYLYNPTCPTNPSDPGQILEYNDNCTTIAGADSCISGWQPSSAGTYHLRIRNLNWDSDYGPDVKYTIEVRQNP